MAFRQRLVTEPRLHEVVCLTTLQNSSSHDVLFYHTLSQLCIVDQAATYSEQQNEQQSSHQPCLTRPDVTGPLPAFFRPSLSILPAPSDQPFINLRFALFRITPFRFPRDSISQWRSDESAVHRRPAHDHSIAHCFRIIIDLGNP